MMDEGDGRAGDGPAAGPGAERVSSRRPRPRAPTSRWSRAPPRTSHRAADAAGDGRPGRARGDGEPAEPADHRPSGPADGDESTQPAARDHRSDAGARRGRVPGASPKVMVQQGEPQVQVEQPQEQAAGVGRAVAGRGQRSRTTSREAQVSVSEARPEVTFRAHRRAAGRVHAGAGASRRSATKRMQQAEQGQRPAGPARQAQMQPP